MNFPTPTVANKHFSDIDIIDQLDKIFIHPDFSNSEILKRFLTYIVHETLNGNARFLKEYTIALKVLEKPVNFNPQKDCIVRIHAGRLRQALANYYTGMGTNDPVIIGIPKGKYVPSFMDPDQWANGQKGNRPVSGEKQCGCSIEPVTFAIMPLICTTEGKLVKAFNDSLCLQMCSTLAQINQVSVIAYQAIKNLSAHYPDMKELSTMMGFNHIVTGGTQYAKHQLRINIQIIESRTYKQIWSNIFKYNAATTNFLDILDDICDHTSTQVKNLVTIT